MKTGRPSDPLRDAILLAARYRLCGFEHSIDAKRLASALTDSGLPTNLHQIYDSRRPGKSVAIQSVENTPVALAILQRLKERHFDSLEISKILDTKHLHLAVRQAADGRNVSGVKEQALLWRRQPLEMPLPCDPSYSAIIFLHDECAKDSRFHDLLERYDVWMNVNSLLGNDFIALLSHDRDLDRLFVVTTDTLVPLPQQLRLLTKTDIERFRSGMAARIFVCRGRLTYEQGDETRLCI